MRILAVDDKEENRYLLESLLKAGGHEAVTADDGLEALARLRDEDFDLIVSDILMPRMDGFQLCRECKKDERLRRIPFVFYTSAYTDRKDEEFALGLGADRFLTKPMDPMDFLRVVDEMQSGAAAPAPSPSTFDGEGDYLKEYSERLVGQLEKKTLELERVNSDLEWELRLNKALARFSNRLISAPATIGDIASVVLDEARSLTSSARGFVSSIDARTGDNVVHAILGLAEDLCVIAEGDRKLNLGAGDGGVYPGLWGKAINDGSPLFTNALQGDEPVGLSSDEGPLRNFMAVPAAIGGNIIGEIALADKDGDYEEREVEAIRHLAKFYALALQRKKAEMALAESEEKIRAVLEGIGDGIVMLDRSLDVTWANRVATARYGRLFGRSFHAAFGHAGESCSCDVARGTMNDGDVRSLEEQVDLGDGTRGYYHVTCSPIMGQENVIEAVVVSFKDVTGRKKEAEELKTSRERLRQLSAHLERVREEERATIAREVHDELGQALTALKMDLSWLRKKLDLEELSRKTADMTRLVDDTVGSVQRITRELRPRILDDLGLAAAVEWQTEEFSRRSEVPCRLTVEPEEIRLDGQRGITVFRVLQEALTNVSRHSGATEVQVKLMERDGRVRLEIRDNGRGVTKDQVGAEGSFGISGMGERVSFCGGQFSITGREGEGTLVVADIPAERRAEPR